MISELPSTGLLYWQQLLKLGEQILSQNSVAGQKDLVIDTAINLVGGSVSLWLAQPAYPLPGQPENLLVEPPTTDLAKRALDFRQVQLQPDSPDDTMPVYAAAIPLISQDTIIGVLQITHPEDVPFKQNELELIQALSYVAATTMQIYRQVALKNWRFEQLALVRSVSFQIANVLDLDELCRRVTRLILHTFKYYYVTIFTLDPGHNTLHFRASSKYSSKIPSQVDGSTSFNVQLGQGIVGFVAQSGDELVACKADEDPHFRFIETLPETKSECAFPIKIGERVLGVLDVQSDQPDAFHEIDILVMRALSDNIALAVEGARLYDAIRRRADQITAVAEIGRVMTSILDLDNLLRQVVELIHMRLGYPFVHLFTVLSDEEKIVFQAGSGERSQSMHTAEVTYDINDPKGIIPWVARNRQSFLSNDVSLDPLYRPNPLAPAGTSSELALPLQFGEEVLGILDIQSDQPDAFDPVELPVFHALADSVAIAIHNAKTYREEQWRRQAAESMRGIAWMLSTNSNPKKVLDSILDELKKDLPCEFSAIWLYGDPDNPSESSATLSLKAIYTKDESALDKIKELDPQSDVSLSNALSSEQPLIRAAQDPLGVLGIALNFPQDFSLISAPLKAGEQVLGMIALAHHKSWRYGPDSQAMIATFASYAAVAIENSRLYATAQEQAWISTVLLQVAQATQALSTIDDLVSSVVRLTPLLVGVKGCAFFLWDADDQVFILIAAHGLSTSQEAEFIQKSISIGATSAFDRLYSERQPLLLVDPVEELKLSADLASDLELNALVLIPLEAQTDLLGAFLIALDAIPYSRAEFETADDERLAIIQGIAQQTAVAMQNIRLLEARQEEAYVTAVLLQVAQTVVNTKNINDLLDSIVQIMPILVGISSSVIYLCDKDHQVFYPAHVCCGSDDFDPVFFKKHFAPGSFPLLDAVWSKDVHATCLISSSHLSPLEWDSLNISSDEENQNKLTSEKSGLLMGFPLSVKGEKYGILVAVESSQSNRSHTRRLEILAGIAQQVSLAIQNDRLQKEMVDRERTEREFHLARQIQRTFLPTHIPELTGWDIDVRWRTARQVGGDFYDFIDLPNGELGLVIADVSDKGLAAALYMSVTRTLIRASVRDDQSPARVLEHVNELLLSNSQSGLFVTAFFAILNPSTGQCVYANAGHNLPLLCNINKKTITGLQKGGMALGALGKIELIDHQCTIETGDCLVMYTDGATETFSPAGELYGDERLIRALQLADTASAQSVLDSIDADLDNFRLDEPVNDDITLLAVKRL